MVSDFIVQHPSGPFFQLSESEYAKAVKKFPILKTTEHLFLTRSATRFIELNGDNYLDNDAVVEQFERLCMMVNFKDEYYGHEIDILVDNATTHTAKPFDVSQFRKGLYFFKSFFVNI